MTSQRYERSISERLVGRIPVRNLWLLMLYASEWVRLNRGFRARIVEDLNDLPDLIGRLLWSEVNRRIRRNLSRGYRRREDVLPRVRGRIDVLKTSTDKLLDRGLVACRFEELTLDTPRNRFVRSALSRISHLAKGQVAAMCRNLSGDLARAGIGGLPPSRGELAQDAIGRNDVVDRYMLALARLAFDIALPTEDAGDTHFAEPDRDEHWVRRLFERGVGGFYALELGSAGWRVQLGETLRWPIAEMSPSLEALLPMMRTDIVLMSPEGHRTVIDTKFTSMVTSVWYRPESLKSDHLYQLYAYLRSQERPDVGAAAMNSATGILLYPSIGRDFDEVVTIQGHKMRFVTVDLSAGAHEIRNRLRWIVAPAETRFLTNV